MKHALFNTVGIDLGAGEQPGSDIVFRATGSVLVEPGFMSVYQEGLDDKAGADDQDRVLPDLKEGEILNLKDLISEQHFTEPPPRFSEASLVKTLEEYGIGRAFYLCLDYLDATKSRVRRAGESPFYSYRHWPDRQPFPYRTLCAIRRLRIHGTYGRRFRRRVPR